MKEYTESDAVYLRTSLNMEKKNTHTLRFCNPVHFVRSIESALKLRIGDIFEIMIPDE